MLAFQYTTTVIGWGYLYTWVWKRRWAIRHRYLCDNVFYNAALLIAIFLKSHDLVIKQLAFYIALYVLMVVFTELIFGMGFSPQAERFEDNTTIITILLILFCAPFLVRFNHRSSIGPVDFYKAYSMSYEAFIFFIATPLFLGMLYLLLTNGVRLTSGFEDHVGDRNIMVDYMYVYYVSILAVFRRSKVLFLLVCWASLSTSSQRREWERLFMYWQFLLHTLICTRRKLSSAVLLMGFEWRRLWGCWGPLILIQVDNATILDP